MKKFSFIQVTFFDGEIISEKHPFLTRKWDADEDVDKKHWVGVSLLDSIAVSLFSKITVRRASLSTLFIITMVIVNFDDVQTCQC